MTDEMQWLREYAQTGAQAAFTRLSERYVNVVYSAARRQVRDVHLAEDVAQAVFIVLAQKAKTVPTDRPLSSWLLKVTGYCAANARRTKARRESYERRAAEMAPQEQSNDWDELAPLLDKGLARLKPADRDALLLKFFEHKSLREVGEALGVSEEAAQKRVTRAVEKLRDYFRRSGAGVTVSAAGLAVLLATETSKAAPAGLAGSVSAGTGAAGGSAGASTGAAALAKGTMVTMATQKTTAVIAAGVVLLLGVGGGAVAVHIIGASNRPRTVDVSALLAPPATASKSGATFSDGSAVQILGISEVPPPSAANKVADFLGIQSAPPAADTWWAPDGSAIPAVPMNGMGQVSAGDTAGRRQIRLIFSMKGPSSGKAGMTIRVPGTTSNAYSSNTRNGETVYNYVGSLPADASRVSISLGLSKGEWREDAIMTLATTTQPTTQYSGAKMFKSLDAGQGNECVLVVDQNRMPRQDRDGVMLGTLKSGKSISPTSWNSDSTGKCEIRFPCRKDQIVKVAWNTRPYEWASLADVALKPATMPAGQAGPTSRVAAAPTP